MISTVRVIHRNVKDWSSGDMCLRWAVAGMLEADPLPPIAAGRRRNVEQVRGCRAGPVRARVERSA
jgi:hypothetical protein